MGKIRIIGGVHRSRQLLVIDALDLRPTLDRVKEILFNWLGQDLTSKNCLDLFAGSGSLGFEACSRGAASVVMVEENPKVAKQLTENAKLLKIEACIKIVCREALAYVNSCSEKFDLIFLDPPYKGNLLSQSLQLVDDKLAKDGKIYIEYENEPLIPDSYRVVKQGKAGNVKFALLELM